MKVEQNIKHSFDENGYYIFRNIIPRGLIESSLNEIDNILKSQWSLYFQAKKYPGKDEAIIQLFSRNINYRRILYEWLNKRTLSPYSYTTLESIKKICIDLEIKSPMFQMAANRFHLPKENDFKTGTHQDIGIMTTENSVTFWLPLITATPDNGSIKLYKGSHREGVIIPEGPDYRGHTWISESITKKYQVIWETFHPGDLVVFSTKTIHTSTPNNSENCRWATIFRFDNGEDNKFFDFADNPLHEGYTMIKDQNSFSGFKPGSKNV